MYMSIYICIYAYEDYAKHVGCHFCQHGEWTSILKFHAARGFAFVEEEALEKTLVTKLGCTAPPVEGGDDRKTELALSLMKKAFPTWSATEVFKAMHRGYVLEEPEVFQESFPVPEDILLELVNVGAHQKIIETGRKTRAAKVTAETVRARALRVAHYFPKGANVLTKPAKTGKHPTWKAKGETPKVAEGTNFLTVAVPQSIQIVEDNHQARWRIICGSGEAKSVSWTKRGVRAASALSLYYAWDLHTAYTGEKPDFNKEGLLADAQKLGSEATA